MKFDILYFLITNLSLGNTTARTNHKCLTYLTKNPSYIKITKRNKYCKHSHLIESYCLYLPVSLILHVLIIRFLLWRIRELLLKLPYFYQNQDKALDRVS